MIQFKRTYGPTQKVFLQLQFIIHEKMPGLACDGCLLRNLEEEVLPPQSPGLSVPQRSTNPAEKEQGSPPQPPLSSWKPRGLIDGCRPWADYKF